MGCTNAKQSAAAPAVAAEGKTLLEATAQGAGSAKAAASTGSEQKQPQAEAVIAETPAPEAAACQAEEAAAAEVSTAEVATAEVSTAEAEEGAKGKTVEVTDNSETIYIDEHKMPAAKRSTKRKATPWVAKADSEATFELEQQEQQCPHWCLFAQCCAPKQGLDDEEDFSS